MVLGLLERSQPGLDPRLPLLNALLGLLAIAKEVGNMQIKEVSDKMCSIFSAHFQTRISQKSISGRLIVAGINNLLHLIIVILDKVLQRNCIYYFSSETSHVRHPILLCIPRNLYKLKERFR